MSELTTLNPRFPPELTDAIFSFLQVTDCVDHFDEGRATLRRCTMDPVLSEFAERHFYSNITVRISADMTEDEAYPGLFPDGWLAKLFSEQPHIPHYVRHMTIILGEFPDSCHFGDILHHVSRLESIALSPDEGVILSWDDMPATFGAALAACIKSPHMNTMLLARQLNVPLSFLDDCSLANLNFQDVQVLDEPQLTPIGVDPSLYPDTLGSLTLNRVQIPDQQFEAWARRRARRLRSLAFSPSEADMFSMLSVLFPICSDTLTSLDLDFLETCQTVYDLNKGTVTLPEDCNRISLTTLPNLQQLTIGAGIVLSHQRTRDFNHVHLRNSSALPTICQLLATSPPSLTRLTLSFRIRFTGDCNTEVLSSMDWQPLVEVLNLPSLTIQQTFLYVYISDHAGLYATQTIRRDQIIPTLCKSEGLSRLVERIGLVIKPFVVEPSR